LVTALKRKRRRGSERGTALFVVVLVITLLTGVGIYAVHTSTLVDRAAGQSNQAAQAAYAAELSTLVAVAHLSTIEGGVRAKEAERALDECSGNEGINYLEVRKPACLKLNQSDLGTSQTGVLVLAPDSLSAGDAEAPLNFRYEIEGTDMSSPNKPMPGMDLGANAKLGFRKFALTSMTHVFPDGGGANVCAGGVAPITGQHQIRAHLIVGPIPN
jgi:hypothetical protein